MTRYFYDSPWEAEYAKSPWFNENHDICADIIHNPPALIKVTLWMLDRTIMGVSFHLPCLQHFITAHYQRLPDFADIYLRNDLLSRAQGRQ